MRTAEQLRFLILAAQREGNRRLAEALSFVALTPAQSEALRIISDHEPLTLRQLGSMLVCDSGTNPSRIVDRLVSTHLIQRNTDPEDRRQILLTATHTGRELNAQVLAIETQLYDTIDSVISPVDVENLIQNLRTLTVDSPSGAALQTRLDAETTGLHR